MMVGHDVKWTPIHIRVKFSDTPNSGQTFLFSNRVVHLGFGKDAVGICYDVVFEALFALSKNST